MLSHTAIQIERVSKRYRIGQRESYRALRDVLSEGLSAPWRAVSTRFGNPDRAATKRQTDHIWALRDVSFEVGVGEVVGIIGRNGAGKSTLLKVLSRVTEPTEGTVRLRGRVGALLEVGTGFHPELTGRENIYLNGAILGMKRAEIDRNFDEIVAFAEVERFLDTPVKHYSSGMYMRLAFSVAAHLQPDILVVDEVLAVGDIAFQRKCLGRMGQVAHEGRTVLFVSHNMQAVRALCNTSVLLSEGRVRAFGPTEAIIGQYHKELLNSQLPSGTELPSERFRRGSGAVRFTSISFVDRAGRSRPDFRMNEFISFCMTFRTTEPVDGLFVAIYFYSGHSSEIVSSVYHPVSLDRIPAGHTGTIVVEFPSINLRPGEYPLYFWLGHRPNSPFDVIDRLTLPLVITTDSTFDELGFDPINASGFFNLQSRIVSHGMAIPHAPVQACEA